MGWFSPNKTKLEYGESVHVLVARAMLQGGIKASSDNLTGSVSYHFYGPHGIEYKGERRVRSSKTPDTIASIAEEVQTDFNIRMAAHDIAVASLEETSLPSLFTKSIRES